MSRTVQETTIKDDRVILFLRNNLWSVLATSQNVPKDGCSSREDDRNNFSFHREKLVNSAVPQLIDIRLYNTFSSGSTEVKVLYFTVDLLSFNSYICCVLQKAYIWSLYKTQICTLPRRSSSLTIQNNNPVLVSLFLQLSKTFSKYCMKLLTLHWWKLSNPILDDVTSIWSPIVSIVALRSWASTSAEWANVAAQQKTETCLLMSARSLKRLTAQPPAPSCPCVLGTFPCIHLAGEHTQSLFSCSDYTANTYRWWCWSHQCWRWHSDPSWNDVS